MLRSEIVVDLDGDGVGKWGEVGKRVQTIHSEVNKICGSNVVNNCIVCLKFAKREDLKCPYHKEKEKRPLELA